MDIVKNNPTQESKRSRIPDAATAARRREDACSSSSSGGSSSDNNNSRVLCTVGKCCNPPPPRRNYRRVRKNKGRWTHEEHLAFLRGVHLYERAWEAVASLVVTRTVLQIRTHSQKYLAKIDQGGTFPEEVRALQVAGCRLQAGCSTMYRECLLKKKRPTRETPQNTGRWRG